MLTKSQQKLINSLSRKKYRGQHQLFCVEGVKGIKEFLNSDYKLEKLFATSDVFEVDESRFQYVTDKELSKISNLKTPNTGLALFKIPAPQAPSNEGLVIALDDVRDPGNLGTIIRLCDWFGIDELVCSKGTVDCYNPKVVQATMGSLTRVNVSYLDLETYLSKANQDVFGTFIDAPSVYEYALPASGILVMGNEANGISEGIAKQIKTRLSIPRFGVSKATESLNVATATAIFLSEFKRRSTER